MLAPTIGPASKTIGSRPRSIRCAAAASPTGPAPITATGNGLAWFISALLDVSKNFNASETVAGFAVRIKFFRYDGRHVVAAARDPVLRTTRGAASQRRRGRRAR